MKKLQLLSAFALVAFSSQLLFAAPVTGGTGPGGVGATDGASSLRLWLRADSILQADSTPVAAWSDQSGWGNHVTASGSAQPTFKTSLVNTRPGVQFDGTTDFLGTAADPVSLQITTGNVYAIGHLRASGFNGVVTYMRNYGVGRQGYFLGERGGAAWMLADNVNYHEGFGLPGWSVNSSQIIALRFDGANVTMRSSGTQITNVPQQRTPTYVAGDRLFLGRQDNATTNLSPLDLSEAIVFNTALNAAQQQLIENHLSSKYDLAIAAAVEHYDGDTMAKGNYDFDVFGIGSVASTNVTSSGMGGFGLEATSAIADNTWALAGHDSGPNGVTNADVPTGLTRWERSFYVDTTGIASANLAFDWNDAGVTAPYEVGYDKLFFRSINSGPFTLLATGTVDSINQRVDFSNITLADGYYTLAGAPPVPEPSTLGLTLLGCLGLACRARHRRRFGKSAAGRV